MSISGLGTSVFNGVPVGSNAQPAPSDAAGAGTPIDPTALDNLAAIDTTRTSVLNLREDLKLLRNSVSVQLETLMVKNQGISPLQAQEIKARVEQQLSAGIAKITTLAENLQKLEHPGNGSDAAKQLRVAISQLMEGINNILGALPAAPPAVDLDSLPRPADILLSGRMQAAVGDPAGATAQDKALGQAMSAIPRTPAQQAELQQTRADLGRVRIELAQDMAFEKDSGMQLPEGEMRSLQERMTANIRRAAELEAKLADQLPGLKPQLDALRQERAQLAKESEAAIRALYKRKDDPAMSRAAFAEALVATNAALLKAAARQGVLTARMDAMLGVISPVELARGQLQDAFNKLAALEATPSILGKSQQQMRQVESTIPLLLKKLAGELGNDESGAMQIAELMRKRAELAAPKPLTLWGWMQPDEATVQKQIATIDNRIGTLLSELQAQAAEARRRPPAGSQPQDAVAQAGGEDAPPRDNRDDTAAAQPIDTMQRPA
jgi:hypothetical protein